ncbi:Transglycosylase SLT domain-containing protein [Aliiroseovarius halocynthiae]|nr:Transglycosylase SLT domain-containing protein [Aliiroseovarius halocynthiae]
MPQISRRSLISCALALPLMSCGGGGDDDFTSPLVSDSFDPPLYPNETPELRALINKWADHYDIPRELVHRQAIRESTHRPWARNGPYWGLLQILPQTARTMGHRGPAEELLDPDVNLQYAGKYLRGAYIVSGGDIDAAMGWYARGYYYEAKRLGLLVETGLRPG